MPEIPIDDLADQRVSVYRDLPRSRKAEESGRFVVEGWLLVERLIASRYPVESILIDRRRVAEFRDRLPDDLPCFVAPAGLIEQLIGFNFHRGVLACGRRPADPCLDEIVSLSPTSTSLIVACAGIQDPTNLGTILRNAAAFGVNGVLLGGQTADPFSRRVIRVSMGAALRLPLYCSVDLAADLERLRRDQTHQLLAAVLDATAERLDQLARPRRFVLLFGNEGHGLPGELVSHCDRRVTLPMAAGTDSLNVAVASGVFLYHFTHCAPQGKPA